MNLRSLLAPVLGAALVWATGALAQAPSYPTKPIRLVVPYPAGGGSDALARMVGQRLSSAFGQPVLIENRGGGNTIIGMQSVVGAPADGYTLLMAASSVSVLPFLRKLPYDIVKDFAPVAPFSTGPQVLIVHPSVASSLPELVAKAKANPESLNYASVGVGTGPHLGGEQFNLKFGVKIKHVPYKGSSQVLPDLLTNRVQIYIIGPISLYEHIKAGKLTPLATSGDKRLTLLPQVPTFEELGMSGFDIETWYGVFAPAGTPKAILERISSEIGQFQTLPDTEEKLQALGLRPLVKSPDQFGTFLRAEMSKYEALIKAADIKSE